MRLPFYNTYRPHCPTLLCLPEQKFQQEQLSWSQHNSRKMSISEERHNKHLLTIKCTVNTGVVYDSAVLLQ